MKRFFFASALTFASVFCGIGQAVSAVSFKNVNPVRLFRSDDGDWFSQDSHYFLGSAGLLAVLTAADLYNEYRLSKNDKSEFSLKNYSLSLFKPKARSGALRHALRGGVWSAALFLSFTSQKAFRERGDVEVPDAIETSGDVEVAQNRRKVRFAGTAVAPPERIDRHTCKRRKVPLVEEGGERGCWPGAKQAVIKPLAKSSDRPKPSKGILKVDRVRRWSVKRG